MIETEDRDYLISGSTDGFFRIWDIGSISYSDQKTILFHRNDQLCEYDTTCRLTCVTCTTKESLFRRHEDLDVHEDLSMSMQDSL